jgi:hypothetical protein
MNKAFLVSLITLLTVIALVGNVYATSDLNLALKSVKINGAEVSVSDTVAAFGGDVVPVKVSFLANEDARDVVIKAELIGYRNDISAKTERFAVENGSIYTKVFSLTLPKDIKVSEEYTIRVSIYNKDKEFERSYSIQMQRSSYDVEVLSADLDRQVEAGATLPVDVVLKNMGYERLDDLYVSVRIPQLGIEKRAYYEDLTPVDEHLENGNDDSKQARIYLNIPMSAEEGLYDVEVIAYNADSETKVTKTVSIIGTKAISEVLATATSREMAMGETAVYSIVIVNRGNSMGVYEIVPESVDKMYVSVDEPLVTVPAGSSKTVNVKVKSGNVEGTYNLAINVNTDGKLVKKLNLTANVVGNKSITTTTSNMTILTVVLAIVFVVLLIVLIVLLTRKPARSDEIEESYY